MRPDCVARLALIRFMVLVLFLVMLPVFALHSLLMRTPMTLVLRFGVLLLLIPLVHVLSLAGLLLVLMAGLLLVMVL